MRTELVTTLKRKATEIIAEVERLPIHPGTVVHDALTKPTQLIAAMAKIGGSRIADLTRAHVQLWTQIYEPVKEIDE